MKYIIIKLCCFDCSVFENIYFTNDNYCDFITNIVGYKDYDYYIYNSDGKFITILGGYDL